MVDVSQMRCTSHEGRAVRAGRPDRLLEARGLLSLSLDTDSDKHAAKI